MAALADQHTLIEGTVCFLEAEALRALFRAHLSGEGSLDPTTPSPLPASFSAVWNEAGKSPHSDMRRVNDPRTGLELAGVGVADEESFQMYVCGHPSLCQNAISAPSVTSCPLAHACSSWGGGEATARGGGVGSKPANQPSRGNGPTSFFFF